MGCCSSRTSAAVYGKSAQYSETGARSLQFATPQIQVRDLTVYISTYAHDYDSSNRKRMAQVHACAAGFFRHATVQQLMCMDVRKDHILAAIGHAEDAALLSAQLCSLPQVQRYCQTSHVVSDQSHMIAQYGCEHPLSCQSEVPT